MNWALDHSGVIIAISITAFLLTVPLNRMVGREFVPERGHGRVDDPHGRARRALRSRAAEETRRFACSRSSRAIDGVAEIEPIVNPGGSGSVGGGGGSNVTHLHFNVQALPVEDRKQTAERR